jgi:hypothetical protein
MSLLSLFAVAFSTMIMASPLAYSATFTEPVQTRTILGRLPAPPTKAANLICTTRVDPVTHENLGVFCRPS